MSTFADRIRELMHEHPELTMNEVDRRIGQHSGCVTRILSGKKKRPGPDIFIGIANAFDVSLDWLIAGKGDKRPWVITSEYDSVYPNRAKAIEIARQDGFSEKAIEKIKSIKLKEGIKDIRISEWLFYIKEEDMRPIADPT